MVKYYFFFSLKGEAFNLWELIINLIICEYYLIILTSITMFLAFPGTDDARANEILLALLIGINI